MRYMMIIICFVLLSTLSMANVDVAINVITNTDVPTQSVDTMLKRFASIPSYNFYPVYHEYSKRRYPNIEQLPAYYFSREIQNNPKTFQSMMRNKLLMSDSSTFAQTTYQVRSGSYDPSIMLGNRRKRGQMELFYRPFCPYGIKALIGLLEVKEKKSTPLRKLILTPMVRELPEKKNHDHENDSAHQHMLDEKFHIAQGLPEMEETVRQLVINKHWSNKLLDYVKLRQPAIRSSYWMAAARQAGLDPDRIIELVGKESEKLLKNAAKEYTRMNVNFSPTYFWQNQKRFNTTDELLNEPKFEKLEINTGKSQCS